MRTAAISVALIAGLLIVGQVQAQSSAKNSDRTQAKTSQDETAEFDKQMSAAEENLHKMQAQMEKIKKTQDLEARQRLMQEHWDTMQGTMRLMQSMHVMNAPGCCAPGSMMDGPMRKGSHGQREEMRRFYFSMTDRQLKEHQYMMGQYMGIQQEMMQNMMWHEMMQRERMGPPVSR